MAVFLRECFLRALTSALVQGRHFVCDFFMGILAIENPKIQQQILFFDDIPIDIPSKLGEDSSGNSCYGDN
jgi:hypothetical protein